MQTSFSMPLISMSLRNTKPGVARIFLQDNFGSFSASADVRNGHILYVYMTSAEFSQAECDRQSRTLIKKNWTSVLNALTRQTSYVLCHQP